MSCILHIETSTEACSVAVSEDGLAVFSKEDLKGPSHAVQLGVFVDEALSFVDSHGMPLDAQNNTMVVHTPVLIQSLGEQTKSLKAEMERQSHIH